jgi:hypothetical protein
VRVGGVVGQVVLAGGLVTDGVVGLATDGVVGLATADGPDGEVGLAMGAAAAAAAVATKFENPTDTWN